MKRMSDKDVERVIREIEKEDVEIDDAQLEALKAEAYAKYIRRSEASARRGGLRRRVMAVTAATMGILVAAFLYSVLVPNAISKANNEVRKVSLWVSDKLHLELKFDQPVDDEPLVGVKEAKVYDSLEEALEELQMPIVGLAEESGFEFENLKVTLDAEEQYLYMSIFQNGEQYVSFSVDTLGDETTATGIEGQSMRINTPLGDAMSWISDDECKAILYMDGYLVRITSNMKQGQFYAMAAYLKLITQP